MSALTKEEFKRRWESDEAGGGITFDDIANCAKDWGIFQTPRIQSLSTVTYFVLKAAGVEDAAVYRDEEEEDCG